MKKYLLLSMMLCLSCMVMAQNYKQANDISYTQKTDAYARQRLLLDVYYPEGQRDCPVVVWFHGGGLEAGNKEIPDKLKGKGMVVVGVNYRLLPKVTVRETLDDAAEAVAWVFRHIEKYGGSTRKITVTGHSAGGYLSMLLCLNKAWLARYDIDADSVMLYAPFSGQAITHYNVRKMQGIGPLQPTIDEFAPLYWVRKDCPPLVLICGDRELELYGRYDENQYLARMMKLTGHRQTYLYELDGHDHGGMVEPSFHILETHIRQLLGDSQTTLKKVYDETVNPLEQIDHAVAKAKSGGKFVICQVGGNWCPWCLRFADFITKDGEISQFIAENFEYIHVNYNPRKSTGKEEQAAALMSRLNQPARFGFPVFVVLGANGQVIHIQDSSFLEEGNGYSKEKVMRFFKNWTPKAVSQ